MNDSDLVENADKNTHNVVERLVLEGKECKKILDIPCGEGAFTKRLAEKHVDVFSADCENIIKFDKVKFRVADMNKQLPYHDGEFDGVVCIDGIEHIERQFDFIRECHRIVKPRGFLIISTPNITALRSRWRWLLTGFHNKCRAPLNERNPMPLHHINMVSLSELRYRLETNGFTITKIATNRIKSISWLYFFLVPFSFIRTFIVFKKEGNNDVLKEINKQVLKWLFSIPVLFGEALIVKAIKRT